MLDHLLSVLLLEWFWQSHICLYNFNSYASMKKYLLLILLTVFILTGCKAKTSFSLTFNEFTIKFYDNKKQYIELPWDTSFPGMEMLKRMQEQEPVASTWYTTGYINSLLIIKLPIQTWINPKELVDANMKTLQLKLLQYTNIDSMVKKVKCDDKQYSWYITTFSYQLNEQTLYEWQYFFIDEMLLYTISLSSDTKKDIDSFVKSIGTITCVN